MIGPQMYGEMDPHRNDRPLQFNSNKGKPPMHGNQEDRDKKDDDVSSTVYMGHNGPGDGMNSMMQGPGPGASNMNNTMMSGPGYFGGPMPGMGFPGPMMGPDPNMMMMFNQFGGWGPMGPMGPEGMGPMPPDMGPYNYNMPREIITLKSCVLYPPPPGAPPPSRRERPPGCRTAFAGGLPENITEDILMEVYETFGNITSIRKSKKNFAHIRFEMEESVDNSLFLSGYRMKIEDKDDKENTGRMHVDYALARDDQYEFECKQRAMAREYRHIQQLEEERLRPPSPPPVVHYSDHEAMTVTEMLKNSESFMKACEILITWLDRGDCSRRSANHFYSLLQTTNAHIRHLLSQKQGHQEELQRCKNQFQQAFEGILRQFDQIEKVFSAALKQKNWDHFSKAQRKTIDIWSKQAQEVKSRQQDEFLSGRVEDEMEMSDEEGEAPAKKKKSDEGPEMTVAEGASLYASMMQMGSAGQVANLKEENDSLKCQVEAYKNEVDLIRQENLNAMEEKEKQMTMLKQALQGMQQQLIQAKQQSKEFQQAKDLLQAQVKAQTKSAPQRKDDATIDLSEGSEEASKETEGKEPSENEPEPGVPEVIIIDEMVKTPTLDIPLVIPFVSSTGLTVTEKEAKLVGLISCFLHVHPTGATVDYVWSYLHRLGIPTRASELEDLLERLPMLFTQELSGVGATIERRWQFVGYRNIATSLTV